MNKWAINTFFNLWKKNNHKNWGILIEKLKLIKSYLKGNPVFFSDFIEKNTELLKWYYIKEKLPSYEVNFLKILDPVLKNSYINYKRIIERNLNLLHNEWLLKTNNKNITYFEILDIYIKLWHSIDLTYTVPNKLIINIQKWIFHNTISINIEVNNLINTNLVNPDFIGIFGPLTEKYNVRIKKGFKKLKKHS